MSARIHTALAFNAGVFFEGRFFMNSYEIDLTLEVDTESIKEQNVALERMKYFLQETLADSVLIQDTETATIEKYLNADLKVCILPEDPYDQVIAIMLISKLNAIAEGRLHVTDIAVGSSLSEGVSCMVSDDDFMGPLEANGWWKECSTKINDLASRPSSKKVVKLIKPGIEWSDVFLGWDEKSAPKEQKPNTEILFASFDSKTDK